MKYLFNNCLSSPNDLVTNRDETRAGFLEAALEKNRKAQPFIDSAKSLRSLASNANKPADLLRISGIRNGLLSASGLSDKAFQYFTEKDKDDAIKKLIHNFLEPAGGSFVDEFIYRYLLIKGDTLGGKMRNYVGEVARLKLIRKLLTLFHLNEISFKVLYKGSYTKWHFANNFETIYEEADRIKAITWNYCNKDKVVFFDSTISIVGKNIDICLYYGGDSFHNVNDISKEKALMFGELKGGIDPAGADEHWKTGNTALERIRNSFLKEDVYVKTSFLAAAIEQNMALEIWEQLSSGILSNAANITVDKQLTNYCDWIIRL